MDSKLFHARIATIAAKLQVLRVLALAGARPIPARHVDIPEINRDVRGRLIVMQDLNTPDPRSKSLRQPAT